MNSAMPGPDGKVDFMSPKPLFRQLAAIIAARIDRGDWKPGEAIPSETRLQQEYGVSRVTVRRAVRELAEQEYLIVLPARGMYVRADREQA